jgi:tetratricopeptide (TPR) repeat protein
MLASIPLTFPERYESAIKSYAKDSIEGINALERFMIKAGEDGVGLILLALMHHCSNDMNKAISYAEKARFMVSGSTFFKTLSYRLRHPDGFDAWIPNQLFTDEPQLEQSPILVAQATELDELINVLSDVENTKIRLDAAKISEPLQHDDLEIEEEVNDIFTETLAQIYMNQNQLLKARNIYQRLIEIEPEKKNQWNEMLTTIDKKMS